VSNGEAKRWYLYTENEALYAVSKNQRGFVPDASTIEVMSVKDHERIVAELKAEIETLGKVYRSTCPECGYSGCVRGRKACDAEIDRQKETIAKQKRVIERLKIIERDFTHHDGDCTEEDSDDNGQPCNCGLDRIRDEIAAIEKGEA